MTWYPYDFGMRRFEFDVEQNIDAIAQLLVFIICLHGFSSIPGKDCVRT